MTPSEFICEALSGKPTERTIDRVRGIVYGVRVNGEFSRNKRAYPLIVQRDAIQLYENRVVNWDHAKGNTDRSTTERFGVLRKIRTEGDGTYADLHFNPFHPRAAEFLWAVENTPETFALSHHARVQWAPRPDASGNRVAVKILEVASVDIVADGGTNLSIFESMEHPMDTAAIAAGITDAASFKTFLMDLLSKLSLSPDDKTSVVEEALASLDPTEMKDESAESDPVVSAAVESLKRRGGKGRWAAEQLSKLFRSNAKAARTQWAKEECTRQGLATEFVSEAFVAGLVQVDDATAKNLILDRKQSFAAVKIPPAVPPINRNSQPGSPVKTVKQMAEDASFK